MLGADFWDDEYATRLQSLTPLSPSSRASTHGRYRRKSGSLHAETDEWIPPGYVQPESLIVELSNGSGRALLARDRASTSHHPTNASTSRPSSRGGKSLSSNGGKVPPDGKVMSRTSSASVLPPQRADSPARIEVKPDPSASATSRNGLRHQDDGEHEGQGHSGDIKIEPVVNMVDMDQEERTSRLLEIHQLKRNLEDAQGALQAAIRDLREAKPRPIGTTPAQGMEGPTSFASDPLDQDSNSHEPVDPSDLHAKREGAVQGEVQVVDADALAGRSLEKLSASLTDVVVERIAAHIGELEERLTEQMDEMERTMIQSIRQIVSSSLSRDSREKSDTGRDQEGLSTDPPQVLKESHGEDQVFKGRNADGGEIVEAAPGSTVPLEENIKTPPDPDGPPPDAQESEVTAGGRKVETPASKSLSRLAGLVAVDDDARVNRVLVEKQLEIDALKLEVAGVKGSLDSLSERFGQQAKAMEALQVNVEAMMNGVKGIQQQQNEVIEAAKKGGCCVIS